MLFYGPPGTGKTQLMKLIIRISGLTKYVEPLGSSELNRGYVGETEALLRDIFRRASYFPSIMFCIAIDEIDSLVPKRESKNENASKKDIVNQFLALIEGASDIKNVYLIGATNHLSKIDKAFARRMQD
jgi:SpoVK/Ycf46/Vps4 family AAA+-type ATPase